MLLWPPCLIPAHMTQEQWCQCWSLWVQSPRSIALGAGCQMKKKQLEGSGPIIQKLHLRVTSETTCLCLQPRLYLTAYFPWNWLPQRWSCKFRQWTLSVTGSIVITHTHFHKRSEWQLTKNGVDMPSLQHFPKKEGRPIWKYYVAYFISW